MGYSPTLGRWLEQDPLGKPGVFASDPVTLEAIGSAKRTTTDVLGEEFADQSWLWQYAGGANLYHFVSSNPLKYTDPSGLEERSWPFNGVIQVCKCFQNDPPVMIWNDQKGWQTIGPGESTPAYSEDWDYIYIGGQYYKVGPFEARVCYGPNGAGVRVVSGGAELQPVPPGDGTPPAPPTTRPTTQPATRP